MTAPSPCCLSWRDDSPIWRGDKKALLISSQSVRFHPLSSRFLGDESLRGGREIDETPHGCSGGGRLCSWRLDLHHLILRLNRLPRCPMGAPDAYSNHLWSQTQQGMYRVDSRVQRGTVKVLLPLKD